MAKGLEDLYDDAKKKSSELWTNIKSAGKDKLKDTFRKFNNALPEIEEAGFVLVRLDLDIALLPRLFARFKQVSVISDKERKAILAKTKKHKFVNMILLGMFKATEIKTEFHIDNMDLKEIELEIGLTPSVKLIFRREDRINLINK